MLLMWMLALLLVLAFISFLALGLCGRLHSSLADACFGGHPPH